MNKRGDLSEQGLQLLADLDSEAELEKKKLELLIDYLQEVEAAVPDALSQQRSLTTDLDKLDVTNLSYQETKRKIAAICVDYRDFLERNKEQVSNRTTFKQQYLTADSYYQDNVQEILNQGNLIQIFDKLAIFLDQLARKGKYVYYLDPRKIYLPNSRQNKLNISQEDLNKITLSKNNRFISRGAIKRFDAIYSELIDVRSGEKAPVRLLNQKIVNYTYLYLWFWTITPEDKRDFRSGNWEHIKDSNLKRENKRLITRLKKIKSELSSSGRKNKDIFEQIVTKINNLNSIRRNKPNGKQGNNQSLNSNQADKIAQYQQEKTFNQHTSNKTSSKGNKNKEIKTSKKEKNKEEKGLFEWELLEKGKKELEKLFGSDKTEK